MMTEQKTENQAITADMNIGQVVQAHPNVIEVFFRHGLGCVGCAIARYESVAEGAQAHGIDVDALIKDLNRAVAQAQ